MSSRPCLATRALRESGKCSARVSDPAESTDRRSPAIPETFGRSGGSVRRPATARVSRRNTYAAIIRCAAAGVLLLASVLLTRTSVAEMYYPPSESKGGWRALVTKNAAPTAAQKAAVLKAAGLETDQLVDAWKYVESLGQRQSLIVIRHGWIVGEWDRVGTAPVNSSTKSLTGLALAKLFELSDAGRLPKKIGYDDLAFNYLPAEWADSDPRKKLIKVRDLPTMCSGLEPMDMGIRDRQMVLALPVVHPPETVDQYSSASVILEGMVIENASGRSLKDFFRKHLSEPIGAESVRLWDAYGAAGYGQMQTRDFARFGYLMLRNGAWDNGRGLQQLVRPDLIAKCTHWPTFLTNVADGQGNNTQWWPAADPPSHLLHTWHGWWVNWSPDWPSSARMVWPFVPRDAFWMSGYGKDLCVVIPSLDMIVAHQTARGDLEKSLNARPEFFPTLLSKVMAAVVTPSSSPSPETTANVERWDTYTHSLNAARFYADPFQDVRLDVTFTHVSLGTRLTVAGFHDGADTWRFRFLPTELGTWRWTTESNDSGLGGKTGTVECVAPAKPYLHGPLRVRGHHFMHVDGTPRFLVSTRLSCQFAFLRAWQPLIAFLKDHRINRVLFMMPGVDSQKSPLHNQRYLFAPEPDFARYNVEAFRAIDAFIDTLRQADILASPYFYYDDMGGTASAWNSQTPDTMRRTIWTGATAGAYTVWGSTATYETGDPLPKMRQSATPPYLRVLHDVLTGLPYQDMQPMNDAVAPADVVVDGERWRTDFALGRPGEAYLVYSLGGGAGKITLAAGRYTALRVDPRDGTKTDLGVVAGGVVGFSLPPGDWVLVYRRIDP